MLPPAYASKSSYMLALSSPPRTSTLSRAPSPAADLLLRSSLRTPLLACVAFVWATPVPTASDSETKCRHPICAVRLSMPFVLAPGTGDLNSVGITLVNTYCRTSVGSTGADPAQSLFFHIDTRTARVGNPPLSRPGGAVRTAREVCLPDACSNRYFCCSEAGLFWRWSVPISHLCSLLSSHRTQSRDVRHTAPASDQLSNSDGLPSLGRTFASTVMDPNDEAPGA
mmetsp:Transcript_18564/g.45601  ORF Transcript_18564/g.45601 Transcript_18564/m.45601 type:complete len:226 (-) Transcript_18564:700-1377(-)